MIRITVQLSAILLFAITASAASAHHSVLNYDGKVEVTITGQVTHARFGFPHSLYRLDVSDENGDVEQWVLSTEDPRDAERLGFADEIRNLKRGDTITVVGWPDKFKRNTLRGHQLIYPDGRVVMMRRGNYIWPKDILRMDKMALNPETIPAAFESTDSSLASIEKLRAWVSEDDYITRVAREIADGEARLIGFESDSAPVNYPGIPELLECHTRRPDFTMPVRMSHPDESTQAYVSEYNRVLARWWEQEKESCE